MKFAEVLEIKNGKNQRQVENPDGEYPIYGSGGIMGWADAYICEADTVIIGRKGTINNPIYVDRPFWNVDTAFGLVANKEILLPKYLYYFCSYFDFESLSTTVTIPSLTKANLLNVEINVPSIMVQEQVVDKLNRVSELISLRKTQISKLEQLVKSRFIEMFGDSTYQERNISEVCKIVTDGTHQSPKFTDSGIPFLFVSNIVDNAITYETSKFISVQTYNELTKRTPIEIGDILLTIVGSYGNPAVVKSDKPFCFQRHLAYMKLKTDIIHPEYLHAAFLSANVKEQIERKVKGIAQKTLNLSELKSIHLPLPPLELQNEFAAFVEQLDKSKFDAALILQERIEGMRTLIQQSLEKTKRQFDALMQVYFK